MSAATNARAELVLTTIAKKRNAIHELAMEVNDSIERMSHDQIENLDTDQFSYNAIAKAMADEIVKRLMHLRKIQ
jgi:hypothetical protein